MAASTLCVPITLGATICLCGSLALILTAAAVCIRSVHPAMAVFTEATSNKSISTISRFPPSATASAFRWSTLIGSEESRTVALTVLPRASRLATTWLPMKPLAPVTVTSPSLTNSAGAAVIEGFSLYRTSSSTEPTTKEGACGAALRASIVASPLSTSTPWTPALSAISMSV